MKRGTSRHPKMKMFARTLGVPLPMAIGLLNLLWEFTADYAPDGAVGKFSNHHISEECGWDGEANKLIEALTADQCRWLDEHDQFRLVVHDWEDHCEDSIHSKLARARKFFVTGNAPKLTKLASNEKDTAIRFYQESSIKQKRTKRTADIPKKAADIPPSAAVSSKSADSESKSAADLPPSAACLSLSLSLSQALPEPEPRPEPDKNLLAQLALSVVCGEQRDVWSPDRQKDFLAELGWVSIKKATPDQITKIMAIDQRDLEDIADQKSLCMIRARLEWFEMEFWPEYWRKVDKQAARIAFFEHIPDWQTHDKAVAAVIRQRPGMLKREVEKQPHAATWINHRRWDDETEASESTGDDLFFAGSIA